MVSTKPPKGTRDVLPAQARRRQYIRETIAAVYEAHGFEPLETPAFERLDTLMGKYGEEGDQLIFRILKRGAELQRALERGEELADLALRYDLTVPLARVTAEHRGQLPRFFRRYQMQPVWRADQPQRGRFREFTQCDADITGCASLVADAEVLSAAGTALGKLGFEDVVLRLNHRDTLFGLIEAAGIAPERESSALVALDKLDKIGWDGVLEELGARGVGASQAAWLRETLETAQGSNAEVLAVLGQRLEGSARGRRGVEQTAELLALTQATPAHALIKVDPCLARGLSYYTGPIFEATSPRLAGSIAGGGRYDKLIGMFAGQEIPAVGFTLGLDRLEVVMEELELFPKRLDRAVDVLVAWMDTPAESLALAVELRAAGLKVEVYPEKEKLGKQLQYAELRNIRLVALMGKDEVKRGEVAVKDLHARTQRGLGRAEVVAALVASASEGVSA